MELQRRFYVRVLIALTTAAPLLATALGVSTLLQPSAARAVASVPYLINFQGRLADNSGNVLADGTYNVKFRIFDAATSGTNRWEGDRVRGASDYRITVQNGLFNIQFGDTTKGDPALSAALFNTQTYANLYLEAELPTPATATCATNGCAVWTEGAMTPRQPLASSPYAFNSDTLDGLDSSDFAQITAANNLTNTNTFSKSGGAGIILSGSAVSGGSILQVGSALSSGSTNGTLIGANGAFTGDLLNLQVSNTTKLKVDNSGNLTLASGAVIAIGASSGAGTTCSGGQVLQNQTTVGGIVTGGSCAIPSGTGANTTLSNLGTTSINASLIPGSNNTLDLGTAAAVWAHTYTALVDAGSTTTTLGIGTSNATAITVGKSGTTTTFNGAVTVSVTGGTSLALTGTPLAGASGATSSLLQVGPNAIASGNATATTGGTYLGLNAPNAGAGSTADFINFQNNGVYKLKVSSTGLVDAAGGFASGGTGGSTIPACGAGTYVSSFQSTGGLVTGGSCATPAGTYTFGTAGDTGSSTVASGQTVTIQGGNGLTSADNGSRVITLAVGAATGITVAADTVGIDQTAALTWTGVETFNKSAGQGAVFSGSAASGGAQLQFGSVAALSSGSANGTYIGSNAAAYTGDFVNFQIGGAVKLKVDNSGNLTAGATIVGTTLNGTTGLNTGAGTGTQRIDANGALAAITGYTQTSGNFSQTGGTHGITSTNASGNVLSLADTALNTNGANLANLTFTNANSTATATTINGISITPTGSVNSNSNANTLNAINLPTVSTVTNNTFNALNVGSNYNSALLVGGTPIINGSGVLLSAGFSGTYSNALSLTNAGNTYAGGTFNGLGLTAAADGFTLAGGTISRTLTVTGANITVGNTIQPTSAGAITLQANGTNSLTLSANAASTWDIGANTLSLQTTNNGAITTGTGTLNHGGNLTFSGTTARTIAGPGSGGLTISDTGGSLTFATLTSGNIAINSVGTLAVASTNFALSTAGTVGAAGKLFAGSVADPGGSTGSLTGVSLNSGSLALVARGAASQSADVAQVQDSTGACVWRVSVAGSTGSCDTTSGSAGTTVSTFKTGDVSSGATGGNTGNFTLRSGNNAAANGNTGSVSIKSGDASGTTGGSGLVQIQSGTAATGITTGGLTLGTGNAFGGGGSGAISIKSGDVTTSNGASGGITIDVGSITTGLKGAITLGGTNASSVTLGNSGGTVILGAPTLQRTVAGATTIDLVDASATTLALTNSGAGVANLTVDGGISIGSGQTYKINNVQIDSSALSNDSSITKQGNTFNGVSQLVQTTAGGLLPTLSGTNLTNLNASNLSQGSGAVTVQSANAANITIDSGTTGIVNIGTDTASAKTINIGPTATNTNTTTLNIGTNIAGTQDVNIGSAAAGTFVSIQGGTTAGTAVVIGTNGAGGITIDSGTSGGINIGNNGNAKTIQVGNATAGTAINIDTGTGGINFGDNANAKSIDIGGVTNSGTDTISIATNGTAADTIAIGNNTAATAVTIDAGTGGKLQLGNTSAAHTIQIGAGGAAAGSAQTVVIGSGTTSTASITNLNGGNITTTTNSNNAGTLTGSGIIIGGGTNSDTNLVGLTLDSTTTFAETASTCSATVNQGTLYYNATSTAIRGCINGAWEDMVSTASLGMQLFGVIPDSGNTPGDLAGVTFSAGTDSGGPCKVVQGSANYTIRWSSCVAYSGGRKVKVAAQLSDVASGVTSGNFGWLCLAAGTGVPAMVGNSTETANQPSFSASAPTLCLAEIKGGATTISAIYDTRTFTTTTKQLVNIVTTATTPGEIVMGNGTTTGQYLIQNATGDQTKNRGVVVATGGGTTANTINAIIATAGPVFIKATAATVNDLVESSTTAGYARTTTTLTFGPYAYLGVNQATVVATCTNNTDTCRSSILTTLTIR